jgi:hypothetical protein
MQLLQKPISLPDLAARVRDMLDRKRSEIEDDASGVRSLFRRVITKNVAPSPKAQWRDNSESCMARAATGIGALSLTMIVSFAAAQDQADLAKFQAFVRNSDAHKGLISKALAALPPTIFRRCPNLVSQGSKVTILKPISFEPGGAPNAGAWKEAFPVAGCGNDTTLNFFFNASKGGKVDTFIGLPGATIADPLLQKDAMTEALAAAARPETKDCKSLDVINTEYLRETGAPVKGSKGPPWDELWTFSACAAKVQVTVHFTPDPTGASISASSTETKILK